MSADPTPMVDPDSPSIGRRTQFKEMLLRNLQLDPRPVWYLTTLCHDTSERCDCNMPCSTSTNHTGTKTQRRDKIPWNLCRKLRYHSTNARPVMAKSCPIYESIPKDSYVPPRGRRPVSIVFHPSTYIRIPSHGPTANLS